MKIGLTIQNGKFIIQKGLLMISAEEVIWKILVAIYSHNVLSEKMYLKGGQALRFVHGLKSRLSRDSDFSFPHKIEKEDIFFNYLKSAIKKEFLKNRLYIIDFKLTRKPKIKPIILIIIMRIMSI